MGDFLRFFGIKYGVNDNVTWSVPVPGEYCFHVIILQVAVPVVDESQAASANLEGGARLPARRSQRAKLAHCHRNPHQHRPRGNWLVPVSRIVFVSINYYVKCTEACIYASYYLSRNRKWIVQFFSRFQVQVTVSLDYGECLYRQATASWELYIVSPFPRALLTVWSFLPTVLHLWLLLDRLTNLAVGS